MKKFLNEYTNIKKMNAEKKEYKQMMAHVKAMPEDYKYVFMNIQKYMHHLKQSCICQPCC